MWPFRRTLRPKPVDPRSAGLQLPPQRSDAPVAFGFNNTWWALPTVDTQAVVSAIRLQNAQPANWQTGVEYAYDRSVFVTPPVKEWTLIVGFRLPPHGEHARSEVVQPLLELSRTFGTALAFSTHHVVEFHVWAKATQGSLIRGYGYLGESGKTLWDEGPI